MRHASNEISSTRVASIEAASIDCVSSDYTECAVTFTLQRPGTGELGSYLFVSGT
jgi:hypothetical protein